jgi:hypothetical protein
LEVNTNMKLVFILLSYIVEYYCYETAQLTYLNYFIDFQESIKNIFQQLMYFEDL